MHLNRLRGESITHYSQNILINYSDAFQMVKMEEHVRELESQLKDMYKGQLGNNQEVLKQVRENKDLGDKVRDLEKKTNVQAERLREYEEILRRQTEEVEKQSVITKAVQQESEALKTINNCLEK